MKGRGVRWWLGALWAVGLSVAPARAEGPVPWAEVARLVKAESLELARERAGLTVVEAERHFASSAPNPTLDVEVLAHVAGRNTFDTAQPTIGIAQPVRVVAKAEARRRAAAANLALAQTGVERFERELLLEARQRYVALQVAEARLAELDALLDEVAAVEAVVRERRRAGVASEFDVNKVRREVAVTRLERDAAALEVEGAGARLGLLLGRGDWAPRAKRLERAGVPAGAEHPELVQAARAVEARRAAERMVERERWPDLVLKGGVALTADDFGVAPFVGVSVDLMAFDKQRAEVERARAEVVVARREQEATATRLAARREAARREVERRVAALTAWDEAMAVGMAPQAREAYAAGRADLLDVLDALRADGEARLNRVALLGAVVAAEVELLEASGATLD